VVFCGVDELLVGGEGVWGFWIVLWLFGLFVGGFDVV